MALQRDTSCPGGCTHLTTKLVSLFVCALLSACALDTRTLETTPSQMNGSGGDGDGGAPPGPTYNAPDPPNVDVPVCSYSEGGVSNDCESLAKNPGFTNDAEGWLEEPYSIKLAWDEADASGNGGSGSLLVINTMPGYTDGIAPGGGMQCLKARPGATYLMAADVFIPEGQGASAIEGEGPFQGQAGLSLLFWKGDDCKDTMPTLANAQSNLIKDPGKWQHVEGVAIAPEGIGSLSIRVLTIKSFKELRFQARFDNVLLQSQ
jgi:hypothetical protein